MPTWSGWQNQFLNRAGLIVTPPNRSLLTLWARNAHSSCPNNPIDLSVNLAGATKCANNTGIHPTTWRYTSHTEAATAFRDEIHQPWAKALFDAVDTGNPFQVANSNDVASVFVSWGSVKMADAYLAAVQGQQGGGGGGGGSKAPHTHSGWKHLQRVVNREIHPAITKSTKLTNAALRSLGRTHKVHG